MSQVSSFLSRSFQFNGKSIQMVTEGFSDADWAHSPSASGGNTAHWILGHIATARRSTARKLGGDLPKENWETTFDMNAKPESTEGYPPPSTLLADIEARGADLAKLLAALSEEAANTEWAPFPDGGKSILEGTHFMFFHESYHVGQLGLLRRITGKPGFV